MSARSPWQLRPAVALPEISVDGPRARGDGAARTAAGVATLRPHAVGRSVWVRKCGLAVTRSTLGFASVLVFGGSVLLALLVLSPTWGVTLVAGALLWELAKKAFWFRSTRRIPVAVGREAMIGRSVTAVSACRPDGWVKLIGERWQARCAVGARVGDRLVVEAVEQITLIVGRPETGAR
jgi:membrane protein implicated in regulation of membrane protease activity